MNNEQQEQDVATVAADFAAALMQWRAVLGEEHVRTTDADLDCYARTCSSSARRALAVLRPASRDEVVALGTYRPDL